MLILYAYSPYAQGYSSLEKKVEDALDAAGGGVACNNKAGKIDMTGAKHTIGHLPNMQKLKLVAR